MTWMTCLRYFNYSKKYSFVSRTLTESLPVIFRVMIGIVPIYMGFVFFGMIMFSELYKFQSFSNALFVLISIMNGDQLWNTFMDMSYLNFVIGFIYMVTFIFFSIRYQFILVNTYD